jgi:hypothetical protein
MISSLFFWPVLPQSEIQLCSSGSALTCWDGTFSALAEALDCMGLPCTIIFRYIHLPAENAVHLKNLNDKITSLLPRTLPLNQVGSFIGPWLEDLWDHLRNESGVDFGFFIPLFVPWNRIWLLDSSVRIPRRYWAIVKSIFALLSPDFLYVTVSQNDDGLEGRDLPFNIPSNLFILSQGGKGHVPLLLWMKELNPDVYSEHLKYDFDVVFLGSFKTHRSRKVMEKIILQLFPNSSFLSRPLENWTQIYQRSKLILCPRGWGRNSYRLGEVLQMGMIPVYIYSDFIWLPYYDSINWSSFAYIARIDELKQVMSRAKAELTLEKVRMMRQKVRDLYATHWSANAVVGQILTLLKWGFQVSDLRCARNSKSRDESSKSFK